jgi:Na+:H+ antiporter, NhaA family
LWFDVTGSQQVQVPSVRREAWSAMEMAMASNRPRNDPPHGDDRASSLRAPWSRSSRRVARAVAQPLQTFLDAEASSGILLLIAAAVALAWANSPWSASYESFWRTVFSVRIGDWTIAEDLRHWVNDGLMALFFLVVGLEIKREFLTGDLRDRRRAAVPVIAAIGGMVVPALIYVALNAGTDAAHGWGVPMATDIAFALGVLTIAAANAPSSMKSFLLTLAIVDDIGAIAVIAVFYSTHIEIGALLVAVALLGAIVVLQRLDVRATVVYVALGIAVWVACYESGVHPTIAGVALGFLTPAVPFQRPRAVSEEAVRTAERTEDEPNPPDADAPQWLRLAWLSREAVSPLARVEDALHPWTSYIVVPLFAFANAGVRLTGGALADAVTSRVTLGVFVALVVGKVVGVVGASRLAIATRIGRLPDGVGGRELVGTAAVAGIGFTVSLFIADLAFDDPALVTDAKVGILAASVVAGLVGFAIVRSVSRRAR